MAGRFWELPSSMKIVAIVSVIIVVLVTLFITVSDNQCSKIPVDSCNQSRTCSTLIEWQLPYCEENQPCPAIFIPEQTCRNKQVAAVEGWWSHPKNFLKNIYWQVYYSITGN